MRLFNKNDSDNENETVFTEQSGSKPETKPEPSSDNSMRLVEEDALLVQIDAFREKAEKLQLLINDRQNKVLELEDVVREKEEKNQALKEVLEHKQEALEEVLEDIKNQLNIFADRLDTSVYNAVNEAKEPVMEKVHTENVRLYRNIYDFLKEEYSEDKLLEIADKGARSGNVFVKIALIFSIANTALLVVLLLFNLGIFR